MQFRAILSESIGRTSELSGNTGGLKAHRAVIDDNKAFKEVIKEDKKTNTFKKKKNEPKS